MWWRKDLLHIFVWANISTILDFDRFKLFIISIQMGMVPMEVLFISVTRMSWCLDKPRNTLWKPLVFRTSVTMIMFCYILADWTTTRHISVSLKSPLWPQRSWGFSPMADHWKVLLGDNAQNYCVTELQIRVGLRSEVMLYIKAAKIALCGPVIVVPVG